MNGRKKVFFIFNHPQVKFRMSDHRKQLHMCKKISAPCFYCFQLLIVCVCVCECVQVCFVRITISNEPPIQFVTAALSLSGSRRIWSLSWELGTRWEYTLDKMQVHHRKWFIVSERPINRKENSQWMELRRHC